MKLILTFIIIMLFSATLFLADAQALSNEKKSPQQESRILANKLTRASPGSTVGTINNNGKLIDLKKDAESRPYVTEHNSNKSLINPNEIHTNSCNFWIQAAVMAIGMVVFVALALTGVGTVLEFMVLTLELAWAYLDSVLLVGGVLGGWGIVYLSQWIAAKACGTKVPESNDNNKHHWEKMPKQGDSIPISNNNLIIGGFNYEI